MSIPYICSYLSTNTLLPGCTPYVYTTYVYICPLTHCCLYINPRYTVLHVCTWCMLLSVPSGDGRMVAIDLRKKGMEEKSDQMESELLCVEVIKVQHKPCYMQQMFLTQSALVSLMTSLGVPSTSNSIYWTNQLFLLPSTYVSLTRDPTNSGTMCKT